LSDPKLPDRPGFPLVASMPFHPDQGFLAWVIMSVGAAICAWHGYSTIGHIL
jgi:hypothetical protein